MVQPEDGSNALRPFASYPRQIPALLEQGAPIVAALAAAAVAMGDLGPLLPTGTCALFLALTLLLLGLFRRRIDQDPTTTPPPPARRFTGWALLASGAFVFYVSDPGVGLLASLGMGVAGAALLCAGENVVRAAADPQRPVRRPAH